MAILEILLWVNYLQLKEQIVSVYNRPRNQIIIKLDAMGGTDDTII